MQAVILAGGFGTRLRQRVVDLPKPMAPVAGRPFLDYLLDPLAEAGCARAMLATGHLADKIEAHVGHSWRGMAIEYSHEETPLGTGGAVLQAMRRLPDEPTLVLNGDTWIGLDLTAFGTWCDRVPDADAIVLRRVEDASRYGRVEIDGERIVAFGEKSGSGPGLINAGVYRLRRSTFARYALPAAFSLESDLFAPHAAELGLRGHVCAGHFIDIGVPEDYDHAQTVLPLWTRR
ncbi:MAG: nucleotidyltransferase family protein [Burkholderiales bacterium]|nr:nucleotidyltransferase family protein [Burkholderiales bacterium]